MFKKRFKRLVKKHPNIFWFGRPQIGLHSKIPWKNPIFLLIYIAIAWCVSQSLPQVIVDGKETLTPAGRIAAFTFFTGVLFWITEIIPPFTTAIFVTAMNVFLLGKPNWVYAEDSSTWKIFVTPYISPIILIFFGGFVLAQTAQKYNLDRYLSRALVEKNGHKPKLFLASVMGATAIFSMFMSNTATTAMMLAILWGVVSKLPASEKKFQTGIALGIAAAANIGGIGTLIGSPPNGIAAANLQENGIAISFADWMMIGTPLSLVMLFIAWKFILWKYPPGPNAQITLPEETSSEKHIKQKWIIGITFGITILLWVTSKLTGMPTAVAALIPILIFSVLGLMEGEDFKKLDWPVLMLVGGGLSLGVAIKGTGFGNYFIQLLFGNTMSPLLLLITLMVAIVLLSNFMSNSAAAAMMIPMVMLMPSPNTVLNAVVVGICASLAMSFPISTPPNALVYSTNAVPSKDLFRTGSMITLMGLILLFIFLKIGEILSFPSFLYN